MTTNSADESVVDLDTGVSSKGEIASYGRRIRLYECSAQTFYESDGPLTIGRNSRGGAGFLNLPSRLVSRRHARISYVGGVYMLTDLSSYNGTFVNDGAISVQTEIKPDDTINVGPYILMLVEPFKPALPIT